MGLTLPKRFGSEEKDNSFNSDTSGSLEDLVKTNKSDFDEFKDVNENVYAGLPGSDNENVYAGLPGSDEVATLPPSYSSIFDNGGKENPTPVPLLPPRNDSFTKSDLKKSISNRKSNTLPLSLPSSQEHSIVVPPIPLRGVTPPPLPHRKSEKMSPKTSKISIAADNNVPPLPQRKVPLKKQKSVEDFRPPLPSRNIGQSSSFSVRSSDTSSLSGQVTEKGDSVEVVTSDNEDQKSGTASAVLPRAGI